MPIMRISTFGKKALTVRVCVREITTTEGRCSAREKGGRLSRYRTAKGREGRHLLIYREEIKQHVRVHFRTQIYCGVPTV